MVDAGFLMIGFGDGTFARLDVSGIIRLGESPEWDRMTFTPYEIVVPSKDDHIVISWSNIRTLTDPEFDDHLEIKFVEQAKRIGARVRNLRQGKQIGSRELADKAGVSLDRLARIEAGSDGISLPTLERIVTALGHDMRVFIVDNEDEPPT